MSEKQEKSPEARAVEGWWNRIIKVLKAGNHEVERQNTGRTYDPYKWKIDGVDIHLSLTARACQTLWVGKTCQKAKIAFGQPEVKFREKKDGFDVQDIAAKVLLYVKHAKEMERKTKERIDAEDAHIARCLKINKDVGVQTKLDPGRSWKCIVSESPYHITTHGAEHFSLEVAGGLSAPQAAQVLQAVHNVLGPKGTAPYRREKK